MAETNFHRLLREKILETVDKEKSDVASGSVPEPFKYGYACGHIAGMFDVLKLCEEIEQKFDGDV